VPKRLFFTPMAGYSAFTGGESFAPRSKITFGSLDFLAEKTGELRLVSPSMASATGPGPRHSTKTKAEKQRLRRRATAQKRRLNKLAAAARQQAEVIHHRLWWPSSVAGLHPSSTSSRTARATPRRSLVQTPTRRKKGPAAPPPEPPIAQEGAGRANQADKDRREQKMAKRTTTEETLTRPKGMKSAVTDASAIEIASPKPLSIRSMVSRPASARSRTNSNRCHSSTSASSPPTGRTGNALPPATTASTACSRRPAEPGAGSDTLGLPPAPTVTDGGGAGAGKGRDEASGCPDKESLRAAAPTAGASPEADANGDESIRTTSGVAAPAAFRMTWVDGVATAGEADDTTPSGTTPTAGGGIPPSSVGSKA
jgi:hypothetical protein